MSSVSQDSSPTRAREHTSARSHAPPEDLAFRLRRSAGRQLLSLVDDWGQVLGMREVRQILLNPHVTPEVIDALGVNRRLLALYEIKVALLRHRRTPEPLAMRLVPQARWRDLVEVSRDLRIRATVRQVAEKYLHRRLPRLTVGEKVALARRSTPETASLLALDGNVRVLEAALENPRLTEEALLPVLISREVSPTHLDRVAGHERWGRRYDVRVALCCNPRSPFRVLFALLPTLRRQDLERVVANDDHSQIVRGRAEELLEASPSLFGGENGEYEAIKIESTDRW